MKIVMLDATTVTRADISFATLEALGDLTRHDRTAPAELKPRLAEAEVVLTNKVVLGPAEMDAAPRLRLICITATGTNNVDLEAAKARDIQVRNVAGYSTPAVVQHVMAFILIFATRTPDYIHEAPESWPQSPIFTRLDYPTFELQNRVLAILGSGDIGSAVGRAAEGLGMQVKAWARPGSDNTAPWTPEGWPRLALADLLPQADFITLHTKLSDETESLIGLETLPLIKNGAYLINCGRGPLLDENAVTAALRSGKLAGLAADVLSQEPPPADHPFFAADLRDKILITPHTSWATIESRQRLIDGVAENIRAWKENRDLNRVV